MPAYQITSPDGKTWEVNAPEGATQDQVLEYAKSQWSKSQPAAKAELQQPQRAPFEDPGMLRSLLIGAGRTFDRIGKGGEQLYYGARSAMSGPDATSLITGGKNQWDVKLDQLKRQAESDDAVYKPLQEARPWATGIGEALPSLAIPGGGGATLGANMARMAVAGALPGALEYGSLGERAGRAALGAAAGAAVPVAGAAIKTGKAFVEPLYAKGREAIAGRVLNRVAGDEAAEVARRLAAARELVPGSAPTAAQVAENGGIAALERAAAQANPSAYTERAMEQSSARLNALRGVARDDASRKAQEEIVQEAAKRLYGEAFKESVEVTPDLVKIASRPSMRKAEARAVSLADELSIPFQSTLDNLRPKYINMGPRQMEARVIDQMPNEFRPIERPELWLTAPRIEADPALKGLGVTREVEDLLYGGRVEPRFVEVPGKTVEKTIPAGKTAPEFMEIPPMEWAPVRDMHTLKMGMDALLQDRTLGIAGREADAIKATREKLLDLLPESYQVARQAHIDLNRPIHEMDIASALLEKLKPALSDHGALGQEAAAQYAAALRNGDKLARDVTGLKNATLESMVSPESRAVFEAVAQDLARKANAQNLGRGVGSDTFQKIAMSNIAEQSGMPRLMGGLLNLPGVGRATRWIYEDADKQMQGLLADALLNPQTSAGLMNKSARGLLADNPKTRQLLEQSVLRAGLLGAPAAYSLTD